MIFEQSEDKVISFSDALSNPRTVVVYSNNCIKKKGSQK